MIQALFAFAKPLMAAGASAAGKAGGLKALAGSERGMSSFSALASVFGGIAEKRAMEQAAFQEQLAGRQALVRGAQEGNQYLSEMNERLGKAAISFSAAGGSLSGSSAGRAIGQAFQAGEDDLGQIEENAYMSALERRTRARALKKRGQVAGLMGFLKAGETLQDQAAKERQRGLPDGS